MLELGLLPGWAGGDPPTDPANALDQPQWNLGSAPADGVDADLFGLLVELDSQFRSESEPEPQADPELIVPVFPFVPPPDPIEPKAPAFILGALGADAPAGDLPAIEIARRELQALRSSVNTNVAINANAADPLKLDGPAVAGAAPAGIHLPQNAAGNLAGNAPNAATAQAIAAGPELQPAIGAENSAAIGAAFNAEISQEITQGIDRGMEQQPQESGQDAKAAQPKPIPPASGNPRVTPDGSAQTEPASALARKPVLLFTPRQSIAPRLDERAWSHHGLLQFNGSRAQTSLAPPVQVQHAQPAAFVAEVQSQIVETVRLAFDVAGGEAHIKLNPREFGNLSVSIRVEQQAVVAVLRADTPAVREWIQANQQVLRDALTFHNLRLDRLEVVQTDESGETSHHDSHRRREADDEVPRRRQRARTEYLFDIDA